MLLFIIIIIYCSSLIVSEWQKKTPRQDKSLVERERSNYPPRPLSHRHDSGGAISGLWQHCLCCSSATWHSGSWIMVAQPGPTSCFFQSVTAAARAEGLVKVHPELRQAEGRAGGAIFRRGGIELQGLHRGNLSTARPFAARTCCQEDLRPFVYHSPQTPEIHPVVSPSFLTSHGPQRH